jgi:KUP system potassium uptake protein
MEAAYGLAITITMIMTTLLLSYYLFQRYPGHLYPFIILAVFLTIEGAFLVANLHKFMYGGWFTLLLASLYFLVMLSWYFARKIRNRHISFSKIADYLPLIKDLSEDRSVPLTATNLVYIIKANNREEVESKVLYSIFQKQPRRAKTYWLVHVDRVDDPVRFEYEVEQIIPGILIRLDFHIGFKVEPKINLYFREAVEDMVKSGEFSPGSSYESLRNHGFPGEFQFILIERILIRDYKLSNWDSFIIALNKITSKISLSDIKALQLDSTITSVEKVPIIIDQSLPVRISRI